MTLWFLRAVLAKNPHAVAQVHVGSPIISSQVLVTCKNDARYEQYEHILDVYFASLVRFQKLI
jgi:hypothetical protein